LCTWKILISKLILVKSRYDLPALATTLYFQSCSKLKVTYHSRVAFYLLLCPTIKFTQTHLKGIENVFKEIHLNSTNWMKRCTINCLAISNKQTFTKLIINHVERFRKKQWSKTYSIFLFRINNYKYKHVKCMKVEN
jgi:hypothetical protein